MAVSSSFRLLVARAGMAALSGSGWWSEEAREELLENRQHHKKP